MKKYRKSARYVAHGIIKVRLRPPRLRQKQMPRNNPARATRAIPVHSSAMKMPATRLDPMPIILCLIYRLLTLTAIALMIANYRARSLRFKRIQYSMAAKGRLFSMRLGSVRS